MKNIYIYIANTDELVFVTNFTIVFDQTLLKSRIVVHANFQCFVIYAVKLHVSSGTSNYSFCVCLTIEMPIQNRMNKGESKNIHLRDAFLRRNIFKFTLVHTILYSHFYSRAYM